MTADSTAPAPLAASSPEALLTLIDRWRAAGSDAAGRDPATLKACADALTDALMAGRALPAAEPETPAAPPEPAPFSIALTETVTVMGIITTAFGDYYVIGKAAPEAYYVTPAASLINGAFDLPAATFFDHCDYVHRLTAARVITVRRLERRLG